MKGKGFHHLVRAVTYPLCVLSSIAFVLGFLGMIWLTSDGEINAVALQIGATGLVLAFGSAMALGATAAYKNAG